MTFTQDKEQTMHANFDRFTLTLTREQCRIGSHAGPCDADIAYLRTVPTIRRQLTKLNSSDVAAELREYGGWTPEELADHDANLSRILWVACGDIHALRDVLGLD